MCHQYFISKSSKSPRTCTVTLTSVTNWFGEEKGCKKMPLDPKTLQENKWRVMIDKWYRERSLRWAVNFSPHSARELRALSHCTFKEKVGHLCSTEILRILALLLSIYSFHTLPAVIVQLWYLKNGSLLAFMLSQLNRCLLLGSCAYLKQVLLNSYHKKGYNVH